MSDSSSSSPPLQQSDGLSFVLDICGVLKKLKRTGWVKHKVPLPESDSDHMHRCAMCALLVSQPADPRDCYEDEHAKKFHPRKVDTMRLLRMAVTHDLCEALAGDITPFCDPSLVESKHDKEDQAMRAIQKVVGDPLGNELYGLWKEYEDLQTVEAIYCKDIDKFEMAVQAFEYEKDHLLSREEAEKKKEKKRKAEELADTGSKEEEKGGKHKDVRADVALEPLRGFFISTNGAIKTPLFRRLDKELRERRQKYLEEKGWDVTDEEQQKPLAK